MRWPTRALHPSLHAGTEIFIKNTITGAALHDKSVIAVRDKFPDVSDEKMSKEDGCLSRSMKIKAYNKIAKETSDVASRGNQDVTLHAP